MQKKRITSSRLRSASKRWIVVALASVLLHLITFSWVNGNISFSFPASEEISTVTALLVPPLTPAKPPAAPARPESPPKKAQLKPEPKVPKEAQTPVPAPQQSPDTTTEPLPVDQPSDPEMVNDEVMSDTAAVGQEKEIESGSEASVEAPSETASREAVDLPPTAELEYDVQGSHKGLSYYGSGIINWHWEEDHYSITGKAKAAFFTVLQFQSKGLIEDSGIAPVVYIEKPRGRNETNTYFHREINRISFSASKASYPINGGEQDRASIIWHLAVVARNNSEAFKPGAEFRVVVAGVKDAEPWVMRVIGDEEIVLDSEKVQTWHIVRSPRPGSREKALDIWLAPEKQWYPVKLRQTEANGDYLEMLLSDITTADQ